METNKKLHEILTEQFGENLKAIFVREEKEDDYYHQDDFSTCEDRARKAILEAAEPVIKTFGYCIADHRETSHDEDRTAEKTVLSNSVSDDMLTADTGSFWYA